MALSSLAAGTDEVAGRPASGSCATFAYGSLVWKANAFQVGRRVLISDERCLLGVGESEEPGGGSLLLVVSEALFSPSL